MTRAYEIEPLPPGHGTGWRLRLMEDGQNAGGAVYPTRTDAGKIAAYGWAKRDGEAWLASFPP